MHVRAGGVYLGTVNPDHQRTERRTVNKALSYIKPAVMGAVATLAVIYVARRLPVVGPTANTLVNKALMG